MEYSHYAAVDIGSNAVRLLIKRLDDAKTGRFSKAVTMRVPLRLGQEVFTQGFVSDKKMHDLVDLMRAYSLVLGIYGVPESHRRFCATCAFREAANSDKVVAEVRKVTGFNIEVISGQEEAEVVSSLRSPSDKRKLVYVDVGGGSTEVSIVSGGKTVERRSYPIGTVKIINNVVSPTWMSDLSASLHHMAERHVSESGVCELEGAVIIGAGGNINKLFGMAQERDMAEQSMSVETLRELRDELKSLTVEQRMVNYKLKADRADVIVPAANIFLTIADSIGVKSIEIPSDGLADGIIADLWRRECGLKQQQSDLQN